MYQACHFFKMQYYSIHHRANDVLTMEERRLLLDTAMKERRQEIQIHNDMLKAQLKAGEEERQKIRYLIYVSEFRYIGFG